MIMNNKLGDMLREWAGKQNPSSEHMAKLASRIRTEIAQDRFADAGSDSKIAIGGRLAYLVLGSALALVIMIALVNSAPVKPVAADDSSLAAITPKKLQDKIMLWNNISDVFNHNLKWICESNGDVGVGVDTLASEESKGDARPIMVHMTTLARKAGETQWKSVWGADMLLGDSQLVEVIPGKESNNKLCLWVFPLEDGKIAVDSSVTLDMPSRVSSTKSYVAEPGKPVEIVNMSDGDMEYKVYQTVQKL